VTADLETRVKRLEDALRALVNATGEIKVSSPDGYAGVPWKWRERVMNVVKLLDETEPPILDLQSTEVRSLPEPPP
jgi:hypothetical protein